MSDPNPRDYFLPYQVRWLMDEARRKIWEKSRRIGATYAQSYEDVRDCIRKPGLPVWFSSADESAAKEYILYSEKWAQIYKKAGEILSLKEEVLDEKNDVKALVLRLKNGSRLNGLSSNPKAFRSKGGKTVLDEFDWHSDQQRMYAAAKPCVTWGFDLRILSTYQSAAALFAQFVRDAKKAILEGRKPTFSLHTVTIFDAVEQGLLDRIVGRSSSDEEKKAWLAEERESCGSEDIWLQEYCCIPSDENDAFLTWDLIRPCESDKAGRPDLAGHGDFYVGNDIGRRKDLAVFWVLELVGDVLWTREVVLMRKASFAAQDDEMDRIVRRYNPRRICIDQTGMGEKPVEDAKRRYGEYRVEGVLFTGPVKQELAFGLRRKFEDRQVRIPVDQGIRRAHHAVKKTTTVAGNIRFDAERTEAGHADEFWAHALAAHAAGGRTWKMEYTSEGTRETTRTHDYGLPPGGRPDVVGW
jgi:phage FluMu gp28-like protein